MRVTAVQELLADAIIAKCDAGWTKKEELADLERGLMKLHEQFASATSADAKAQLTRAIRNIEVAIRTVKARPDARNHGGMGEEKALREDLTQAHRALERAIRTRDAEAIKELREEIAKIESKMRGDGADTLFAINVLFDRPWGERPNIPTIKRYELRATSVRAAMEAAKKKYADDYGLSSADTRKLSASNVSV